MRLIFSAATALFFLSACTTVNQSAPSSFSGPETRGCLSYQTDVGEDVKGEGTVTRILGFIRIGDSEFADGIGYGTSNNGFTLGFSDAEDAKSAAAFKAISETKAHTIIAPRYSVKEDNYFLIKFTRAKVSGKRGNLRDFTNINCNTLATEFINANKR